MLGACALYSPEVSLTTTLTISVSSLQKFLIELVDSNTISHSAIPTTFKRYEFKISQLVFVPNHASSQRRASPGNTLGADSGRSF
mmetsp:Transcript_5776/g.8078  ORF Transcript_5776/g.8078 Transcript_5776/m.8078 type:complete len:85 (+) Transcript_5776:26-280(+)